MHTAVSPPRAIEAPASFRRAVLGGALVLLALELGLFAAAWRLQEVPPPADDPVALGVLVLLGTVLTLQAMAVAGLAWLMVAMSRTALVFDAGGLTLSHPWRRWRGAFDRVSRAWHRRGWLVITVTGSTRAWYVRCREEHPELRAFRERLPSEAWLEGAALRAHLARRVLPAAVAIAVAGGLALWGVLRLLAGVGPR